MAKTVPKDDFKRVRCNLCRADSSRTAMRIDGFSIVQCGKCGLKYVNPRLKEGVLHRIYDEEYYRNTAFRGSDAVFYGYGEYLKDEQDIKATFRRRMDVIGRLVRKGNLLDVGCATGFFLEVAKERGWKVQGLELSRFAYGYAKRKRNLPVINRTLEQANFREGTFDAVTIFDVIEHLPDPKRTVAEIHRVLRKGGIVAITTPDIGSLVARLLGKKWEEVRRVREHIYFFSEETLRKMLESVGFEVLKVETAGRYFSVKSAVERGKLYSRPVFSVVEALAKAFGLMGRKVYVDPRYKMTIYARKK
ncbi:TPA: class I SAM-dependent methyltransferase [Candidatus Woesearchaeota archaeon]|nr:class I SAM-dependent methyltransferase [Candidatus Woesearchaeota archaeon]HII64192.1 class I SAM-dependent methyltransferase [Candidatus Woesearchaeota archaeon]HIJ19081.1 class I SAM-dependent methyltransferase [Candidatus Woesearchaeota archaeon]